MQLIVIINNVTDLEQREDEAKTERGNDEMAAKNLQAEVRILSCRLKKNHFKKKNSCTTCCRVQINYFCFEDKSCSVATLNFLFISFAR